MSISKPIQENIFFGLALSCLGVSNKITKFALVYSFDVVMADLNRLKVVLAEEKRTSVWLAEQLGVNRTTVSKWCTNTNQPDLNTLAKIAELLRVDISHLLNKTLIKD